MNKVNHRGETSQIPLDDGVECLEDYGKNAVVGSIYKRTLTFPNPIRLLAVDRVTRGDETYRQFIKRLESNPIARKVKLTDLEDIMKFQRLEDVKSGDWADWQNISDGGLICADQLWFQRTFQT